MRELLVEGPADGVLTLTLNRPEKRNALSLALVDALHDALAQADLDADVRVVALRGAGSDFCAGADLAELLASADRAPADNERDALRLGELFLRIRRFPRPVVAVVHGRALAGGAGLATACDLVLAARSAELGYPEIGRGFVPAMVLTILRRVAGERVAFELAATGRPISADEARRLGLVTAVHDDAELAGAATALLSALARQSPGATALTKQLCYELDGLGFEEGIRLGARINALARTTPDFKAGIARFLAK